MNDCEIWVLSGTLNAQGYLSDAHFITTSHFTSTPKSMASIIDNVLRKTFIILLTGNRMFSMFNTWGLRFIYFVELESMWHDKWMNVRLKGLVEFGGRRLALWRSAWWGCMLPLKYRNICSFGNQHFHNKNEFNGIKINQYNQSLPNWC